MRSGQNAPTYIRRTLSALLLVYTDGNRRLNSPKDGGPLARPWICAGGARRLERPKNYLVGRPLKSDIIMCSRGLAAIKPELTYVGHSQLCYQYIQTGPAAEKPEGIYIG